MGLPKGASVTNNDYLCSWKPKHNNVMMELRQLRYFLMVTETLNFSAASRRLFISQSNLSQQISQLEREVGQPLFDRNSHEVHLTEAGKQLAPMARKALDSVTECMEHMADLNALQMGELNIGVTYSFASMVTEAVITFLRKYPKVRLNIRYASMGELMEMLKRRELDIFLALSPLKGDAAIDSRQLFDNRLAVIVNKRHPLCSAKHIGLAELQHYDLVLPARGLQARNTFEQLVDGTGYTYNVKVEVNNVGLLFDLISHARYATILAESTVSRTHDLKAIPIEAEGNEMRGCIHLLKGAYVKQSAREFIEMLTQTTSALVSRVLDGASR